MRESGRESRGLPEITFQAYDFETLLVIPQIRQNGKGRIIAAVVHDDNFIALRGCPQSPDDLVDQRLDIFFLVVNRDNNRKLHGLGGGRLSEHSIPSCHFHRLE
jgi:hypothetical protein